ISTVGGTVAVFGSDPIVTIAAVWMANLLMIGLIHAGLKRRNQRWAHLGLEWAWPTIRSVLRVFLLSLPVFVCSIGAFVIAAVVMANLVGMPEAADMSKYDYLRGNLPMTVLALASVYCVSSFAEEVIYRGFMITRIREAAGDRAASTPLAVVISSAVFGLVHSDWGITGMVLATFMGAALGTSFLIVRRNLWITILAHAYMDTILVLQMYFAAP
ncbi:MAG: CPBP family intramembrane glutamic endopeptidase, partial [Planctomycetota bacterium]